MIEPSSALSMFVGVTGLAAPTATGSGSAAEARPGRGVRTIGGYQPGLDGIRALAVLAVAAYHAQLPHTSGGFLGVSLFFTLSGFLITALLLDEYERTDRIDLREFWLRRFRRLVPAALLGLAVAVLFASVCAPSIDSFSRHLRARRAEVRSG
jgi:peptidoglycan/LPS O-acetylase OafA/YrhL